MYEEMSLSFVCFCLFFVQKAHVYRSCLAPIETLSECVSVYPADVKITQKLLQKFSPLR